MKKHIPLILRIIVAGILIQTLRFKFLAHPDSIYIFNKVGLEPYGRIGIGLLELISGVLLLIPKTVWIGASLTIGILGGAILMHLTLLGVVIKNDGGLLFGTAVLTFLLAMIILYLSRRDIPLFIKTLTNFNK
ncbi:DoxX family membrane protein [Algibacter pectinivorans]|uniref:DoxX-like family protein n=1 Tax=Algibacter pectinivorans TaxID=870482 RepID=A0A1I1RFH7_9FLAO|nr:DoxX family membrane protein [Algibacter pectinivorans]SFD29150.1 DoxX-like family protein [Algibacter pectinivorans]